MNLFYSTLLIIAAALSASISIMAWQRRKKTLAALPMAVVNIAMAWWSFSYAVHWSAVSRPSEFFWVDLTYLGVVIVPTAFFAFAICYTGYCRRLTPRVLALLSIEPLLTLFLLYTDPQFGLFFAGKRAPGDAAIFNGGLGFWVNVFYSYALVFLAIAIIYLAFQQSSAGQRREQRIVLLAVAIPLLADMIVIFAIGDRLNLDITPIAFTITSAIFFYGIFQQGLMDIVPMARNTLVENMTDGMLVLDQNNRIMDINLSGAFTLRIKGETPIGKPVEQALSHLPDTIFRFIEIQEGQSELMFPGPSPEFYDVYITPICNQGGEFIGRLISFRDITRQKEIEMELRNANQRLQFQLAEIENLQDQLREQAIRDPLTGLYNRRYLNDALERELHRAKREHIPLCLVLIDLDHFKQCNDTYGHPAGDIVLQALADLLRETTRQEDIVCRYGGEEFLVVLPGISPETAYQRADFWRQKFEKLCISLNGTQICTTFSAGVACYPVDGEMIALLMKSADDALYKAKQTGRNRVFALKMNDLR